MSNQTKGTTTNLTKLVSWDIDLYNSMSAEEDCLILLSERDKYLLRNALRQVKWLTRWTSEIGTQQPDRSLISENMAFKLSQEYCMDFCQMMIDCIETTPALRDAIQDSVGGYSDVDGNPLRWQTDAIETVPGCNLDDTWGYVKALWDYINQNNKDFLQILAEAGNQQEQIARMISGIPLFNQLPFDEIADWLGSLGDYNLEAYNASITTEINEKIWCDLFCIAQDQGCHLTFEDVWEYMLGEFGGVNFPTLGATFAELVLFMVTGTYLNDRIVYLWTLVQLGIMFIGAEFLGVSSMNTYAIHAQNGDPDDDWQTLCDDCPSFWSHEFVFESPTPAGWTITIGTQDTDYILSAVTQFPSWQEQDILAQIAFDERVVTRVVFDTYMTNPRPDPANHELTVYDQNGEFFSWHVFVFNQQIELSWNGYRNMSFFQFRQLCDVSGENRVYKITLYGEGTNPF